MYRDVSAIAVTAGTSGKGGSWGVRPAAGIAFLPRSCRDPSAPRRKRRGTLVVMTNQEKAPACRPATTKASPERNWSRCGQNRQRRLRHL